MGQGAAPILSPAPVPFCAAQMQHQRSQARGPPCSAEAEGPRGLCTAVDTPNVHAQMACGRPPPHHSPQLAMARPPPPQSAVALRVSAARTELLAGSPTPNPPEPGTWQLGQGSCLAGHCCRRHTPARAVLCLLIARRPYVYGCGDFTHACHRQHLAIMARWQRAGRHPNKRQLPGMMHARLL